MDIKLLKLVARIAAKIVWGAVIGLLYYAVYVVVLPKLVSAAVHAPIEVPEFFSYMWFFVALGIAETVLRNHVVSVPIRMLSKLLGALVLYVALNGGVLSETIVVGGTSIIVYEFDLSPVLYAVILLSLVLGAVDAFTYFSERNMF